MDCLPDEVILEIFLNIPWILRLKLESVSKKWLRILRNSKELRMIDCLDLDSLVIRNNNSANGLSQIINSLLIISRKVINKLIIVNQNINTYDVVEIMQTVLSTQTESLTNLTISTTSQQVFNNINSLIHLQVLDVDYSRGAEQAIIDLSQLMQLKVLKGNRVRYINCRSSLLTNFHYSNVALNNLNEITDFIQMLDETKESIEVLDLSIVRLGKSKEILFNLKLPKLLELSVDKCLLFGLTIDLVESTGLKVIHVGGCIYSIINLDLSIIRSLVRFVVYYNNVINLSYYKPINNDIFCITGIINQFITSAVANPASLSVLEELRIGSITSDQLFELLSCFSYFNNYCLRKFIVNTVPTNVILHDSDALVIFIKQCPHLSHLYFHHVDVDKDCLINLIIATVPLDIKLGIRFKSIINCTPTDFINDLLIALSLIDSSTICHSDVSVECWRLDLSECCAIVEQIDSRFGIKIFCA